jgi:hypothetical protein
MAKGPKVTQAQIDYTPAGTVVMVIPDRDTGQPYTIEMTPKTAREIGDSLFRAGCQAKPPSSSPT